jgi:hypothetical protein
VASARFLFFVISFTKFVQPFRAGQYNKRYSCNTIPPLDVQPFVGTCSHRPHGFKAQHLSSPTTIMAPNRVVVRLRPGSDGDATHVPKQGHYTQINPPTLYLEKIADQWMAAKGEGRPGVKYILECLPVGYTLWQRPRGSNSQHTDKYLYGHPRVKHFDSPNRFYPHFEYLMANSGSNIGCPCTVCSGSSGVLPGVCTIARNMSPTRSGKYSRYSLTMLLLTQRRYVKSRSYSG